MTTAIKVKPDIAEGTTAQGFYVVGADGSAYAFNNNRSVERVMGMLDKGSQGFAKSPPQRVEFDAETLSRNTVRKPPVETLVLRVFSRISPVPEGCDAANENVARDHLWLLAEEQAAFAQGKIPENFIKRLCRFNLVDNIRGEPDHWKKNEVTISKFDLSDQGNGVFRLKGEFAMKTANDSRGVEGDLTAEIRVSKGKVVELKAYGETKAWGASTYAPNPPQGKFPLHFAIVTVSDTMSKVVAPQAVFFGNEYFSP